MEAAIYYRLLYAALGIDEPGALDQAIVLRCRRAAHRSTTTSSNASSAAFEILAAYCPPTPGHPLAERR